MSIPEKINAHPMSSVGEGSVWRNTSARIIVKGICIEKSKACRQGPSLLRHTKSFLPPGRSTAASIDFEYLSPK